ncbi:uncharacterized protein [Halyomorpha halys]|uniref:uncharacterized protein n=1 Tax=Halyomorpha halys TaxID=286706 RepID=UPI0006D501EC|nr:uncharacterized protein LOC106678655 [Halyomorpha halys]XP_014272818.1 uncharacterized protein LOC106678655 [Halyomorpha halys]XP_014272819.1 uncharacterized protein LOC106678655 [Halyomorpha halys]XP_014272820.1 uncharacterized protein LOC106678655 [Halyomorpha halys]
MLMDTANNNDINKNEKKQILLIEGPPAADPLLNRFMSLKVDDSIQQDLNLEEQDHFDTASTTTIFGSYFSNDSQLKRSNSESDEENQNKSVSDLRKKYLEDERKWLRYKVDSVTKEQAIIFCILGQLLLPSEDIKGSRKEIPLPEDAKQILLFMTYGDHWLLRDLSYVLGYVDKVNSLIMSFEGLVDLKSSSRSYLEALIINQFGIPKNEICYESDG